MIIRFLGASGDHLLKCLDDCTTKVGGKDVAKTMKNNIFKLATKVGVLYQNHDLTERDGALAREPVLSMINYMIDSLEAPENMRSVNDMMNLMSEAHNALLPTLQPHMKPANAERLTAVFQFYGSRDFLQHFFFDLQLEAERLTFLRCLKRLMHPSDGEAQGSKEFQKDRLQQKQARLRQLVDNHRLVDFLHIEEGMKCFREWFISQSTDHANLFIFFQQIDDFRVIQNRQLLQGRAKTIFDKYCTPSADHFVRLPEELVTTLSNFLDEDNIRKNIFNDIEAHIMARLEAGFSSGFLQSASYQDIIHELESVNYKLHVQHGIETEEAKGEAAVAADDDDAEDDDDDDDDRRK